MSQIVKGQKRQFNYSKVINNEGSVRTSRFGKLDNTKHQWVQPHSMLSSHDEMYEMFCDMSINDLRKCMIIPYVSMNGVTPFIISNYPSHLSKYVDYYERLIGRINIEDENVRESKLPRLLEHISDAIQDAKVILSYEDDWDDNGSLSTDTQTWDNAIKFLIDYSTLIYGKYGVVLEKPYIDIALDGGIYIHWDTPRGKFLIMFKKNINELAYFYGESKQDKIPFKSAIKIQSPVQESIGLWMKEYLAK